MSLAQDVLREDLIGVYLQGSFAVGDADEHSDVDFLVVVREDLDGATVERLREGHARLHDTPTEWAKHLEGSYFPAERLRQHERTGEAVWYFDNGSLVPERSDHDDTLVVRWTMREHGIALFGPEPRTLIAPIPDEALKAEMRATIHDWGSEILRENPRWLGTRWGYAYAVLSFCRMRHTLVIGRIESKRAGAAWAREVLAPRWRDLIDAAWAERPDPWTKVRQPADPDRVAETIEFIREAVNPKGL